MKSFKHLNKGASIIVVPSDTLSSYYFSQYNTMIHKP